ncbi:AGAP004265-PA-like protein [Anopheles sinensis]|uniref:Zinc finger CCCH domain-containing protein 14 n=1 Tax=Anopheles sinensis TaxID=74873 RepID=A0A084WP03_ANOSI|nr:AGAP004265-PA-like protein [Anopheles sinensis]
MDSLGTEIGQKMRSAVKAKLIELGTGSASGYIDDELPDYVMIMVANKRSRQQMIDDLSLFLGAQTEVFVNWLHQVLQKLQEVTLPASAATKKKPSEAEEKRKDKKRKDKKAKRRDRSTDNEEEATDEPGPTRSTDGNNTPPQPAVVLPGSSITEVFANQYIEKAKKSLESAPITKKTPQESAAARDQRSKTPPTTRALPSITEIASATVVRKHHKELCELEEIQQRINEAKRHLKTLGTDISDDDDEDLLHLKANEDDLETEESRNERTSTAVARSNKPVDREATVNKQRQRITIASPEPSKQVTAARNTTPPKTSEKDTSASSTVAKKRSVLDRLGTKSSVTSDSAKNEKSKASEPDANEISSKTATKPAATGTESTNNTKSTIISLSAHRREEREIYVPLFRRKEESSYRRGARAENPPVREARTRERSRSRERNSASGRERSASIGRQSKNGIDSVRGRIGSRIIVLPPKPEFQEDEIEVPVASVIKVQPRPTMPKSKQPSKNLLLKAMAEAQRSTVATVRKTIDNTPSMMDSKLSHYSRMEGKRKLVIEIPGGHSVHPGMEVQYADEDEEHYQLHRNVPLYGEFLDDEEVHEVDLAKQVLMEECDVDEEFKDILQSENEAATHRIHQREQPHHSEYAAEDSENMVHPATTMAESENTKFVVTLDGAYKSILDGDGSPSHTPPPPASSVVGGTVKGRLSVKDRIGPKQPSSSSRERSPKAKDSKELEETLKKRKERFSEKLVAVSAPKSPQPKKSLSPPPPSTTTNRGSKQQSQPRSPKLPSSTRSSHSTQSHASSQRRTPSPGHLNELLLQRTRELMDDSVSSSPIYMSKSDYDKMEPSSRKRKRVSPIQFDLTDEDDMHDSEDDYHRDRRARSRDERNPRRSRQRDSEERRSAPRKDSRREWDRESERRDSNAARQSPGKKIKKLESSRKFDDLPPLLSAVTVSDGKTHKSVGGGAIKERCKYFPNCRQGDACEFLHPSTPCKAFPNCKFGDKCLYLHPMCKYDLTCHRLDCTFMHTKGSSVAGSSSSLAAPPLASSVVPVQNYKTISAKPLPPLCKFYPNCVNGQCPFYHPKMCRFGRHCVNKVECNFYHHELPPSEMHEASAKDKFKWISPFSA